MSPTLHRPPTIGDDTHHRLEFLHGIDLERVHVRRPSPRLAWIGGGILVVLLALVIGVALEGASTAPDDATAATLSLHDSGIAQAVAARESTVTSIHDSGIAQAVQARESADTSTHDSGIAQAVAARESTVTSTHDSGIAQAVQAHQAELDAAHDSGIDLALRYR